MQGRTKGVFEDVFVLLIIVLLGWGGYTFFFLEDKKQLPDTELVYSQDTPKQQEHTTASLQPKKTETPKRSVTKVEKNSINEQSLSKNLNKKVEKQEVVKKEKKDMTSVVDLQVLQKFLIGTKQKIKKTIVLDNKNNKEKKRLSIRVTVLKNGSYEQLIFTGGNKSIFKNNYNNITRLFPLKISESIIDEFPRYLRYSFEFSVKDE